MQIYYKIVNDSTLLFIHTITYSFYNLFIIYLIKNNIIDVDEIKVKKDKELSKYLV